MKKIIYFFAFLFLLCAFSLNAQPEPIPDGDFETSWENHFDFENKPYWEYKTMYFYTLNSLRGLLNEQGLADLTAYRDKNAQHGEYCIKLVSGDIPVGDEYIFLPGMVGTITQEFVYEFIHEEGNVTITRDWAFDTPHALEGWYKYNPVGNDSALIDIGFYNYDEEKFVEKKTIYETVNEWTHFLIEIPQKYHDEFFNKIRVLFVSSAGVNFTELQKCKGQKKSTLWIDNITLNYTHIPGGIKQNLFSTLTAKAFPNPAAEVLNIELNEHFTGTVMVYNLQGSLIIEENVNGTQCQLNTSALATGNYIYKLMNENTIFAQGKFVVTK